MVKIELWRDLNDDIYGSFEGLETEAGEGSKMVFPKYYPMSKNPLKRIIYGKPIKYNKAIKEDNIFYYTPVKKGYEGVPDLIVYHYDPERECKMKVNFDSTYKRLLSETKKELQSAKIKITQLEKDLRNSKSSASKYVSDANKVVGRNQRQDFGGNYFPSGYNGFNNGDI